MTFIASSFNPPPLFAMGLPVTSPEVDALITQGKLDIMIYLRRHLTGDWGHVKKVISHSNGRALKSGNYSLFSCYPVTQTRDLWIITQPQPRVTKLMLLRNAIRFQRAV